MLSIYLLNEMLYTRKNFNEDAKHIFNSFSYHIPRLIFLSTFISIGRGIIQYKTQDFAVSWYLKATTKNTEVYKDKIKPVISNVIWYIGITVFGYIWVAYKNEIVPKTLGGSMDYDRVFSQRFPYLNMREIDFIYFHIQFGTKFYSFLKTLLFERDFADFWEMFLHHILSILLIILSLFTNFTEVGLSVLLIHDPGDIALNLIKIYKYMIPKKHKSTILTIFISVSSLTCWIIPRIIIQPISIFIRFYDALKNTKDVIAFEVTDDILKSCLILNSAIFIGLLILYFMNVYWTYLALKFVRSLIFKNAPEFHHGVKVKRLEKDKIK